MALTPLRLEKHSATCLISYNTPKVYQRGYIHQNWIPLITLISLITFSLGQPCTWNSLYWRWSHMWNCNWFLVHLTTDCSGQTLIPKKKCQENLDAGRIPDRTQAFWLIAVHALFTVGGRCRSWKWDSHRGGNILGQMAQIYCCCVSG